MSQKKRLEGNIEYLERFVLDIEKIKENVSTRYTARSYDEACDEVFTHIRKLCQAKISETLEHGDKELAQSMQDFSNQVLKIVADIKQANWDTIEKSKHQVSLLEEIIQSSNNSKDTLHSQIPEEENILTEPPPIRGDLAVDVPKEKVRF
jgi:hypothetical protein